MIVEVGREVQQVAGNIMEYLNMIGVAPRSYGEWIRSYVAGTLVAQPPRPPSQETLKKLDELKAELIDLDHRQHCTHGLEPLFQKYKGQVTREVFRRLAMEARAEAKRIFRNKMQRYEFVTRDVCHSMDYTAMPLEFPGSPKRYLIKIMDECSRLNLKHAITEHKGAGVGARFVLDHFKAGNIPLVFKYDREFDVPQFEELLIMYKVVPLPCPGAYPPFNGKTERSNRDLQQWLGTFESDKFWGYDELSKEVDICFTQLDEVYQRTMFGGRTCRQVYQELKPPSVDREQFFREADQFRRSLLARPGKPMHPADAWRIAAKETLKKWDLVKYGRP